MNSQMRIADDIMAEILSYFVFESVAKLSVLSKKFKSTAAKMGLWKKKVRLHFPHIYKSLEMGIGIHWKNEFIKAYQNEYKVHDRESPVSQKQRQLFSLVKEGAISHLGRFNNVTLNDLDQTDVNGISLFEWAKKQNNQHMLDCIYRLVCQSYQLNEYTYDLTKKDHQTRTLLHWAILCHQSANTIEELITHGADVNAKMSTAKFTGNVIHLASKEGHLSGVKSLLEHQPTLRDHPDLLGQTPLMWAISEGHTKLVAYLIQQEANIDLKYKKGARTQVIHLACFQGRLDIVQLLIEKDKTLLNRVDDYGQSPLIWAASGGHVDIVEYLVKEGADLDLQSNNLGAGYTALHWACNRSYNKIAEILINQGAQLNLEGTSNRAAHPRPIHLACANGPLDIVKNLIEKEPALLDQLDSTNQTPITWAASEGKAEIVDYLVKKGAKLDCQSSSNAPDGTAGFTALHWASRQGHTKTLKVLLDHSAENKMDIEIRDRQGKTFADVAPKDSFFAAELKLMVYAKKVDQRDDDDYHLSVTLFGKQFNKGYSAKQKKEAAQALMNVSFNKADPACLIPHQKVLNDGELKSIYQGLKIR